MNLETSNVILVEVEKSVATVKINRPKALNALNQEVLKNLSEVFDCIEKNPEVRSVVLTGSGEKSFVAGADIKEMQNFGEKESYDMSISGQKVFNQIERLTKPCIAAVNGFALGGGLELALSCDFIIAVEEAKFALPEVSLGLIPGYGGTQRLARNIGLQKAKRLIFTGEMISASKAYDWGLVSEVCSAAELYDKAQKLATKISRMAPLALSFAKKSVAQGFDLPLDEGLKAEAVYFSKTFITEDKTEGINAFIDKRKAQFVGK